MRGYAHRVYTVALSADGRTIVSGSYHDNTLKVWDAESGACRATYPLGSKEARAAWKSVSRLDESHRLFPDGGPLQFQLGLLAKTRQTDATVAESLIAPGNFAQAYGPLAGDTILAFTANGEALWFRLRRHDGERCAIVQGGNF